MKPAIFIGSSTEGLSVANAIQENLEYDANVTIWTQGIFKPSGTVITDLLNVIPTFDFAIFVFNADDIATIRQTQYSITRDNVVFELGLFIGKLGRDRVFYVIPRGVEDLHLPSDLLGVTPGTYNNERTDQNLVAAVGSFCNQIRSQVKTFVYESFDFLSSETREAKRIAVEKPHSWEFFLFSELLERRLISIKEQYADLQNEVVFIKTQLFTSIQFFYWYRENLQDMIKLVILFNNLFKSPMEEAFGPSGVPGNPKKIKELADKFFAYSKELLKWEVRLAAIKPPEDLESIKTAMQGWAKDLFDKIFTIPSEMRRLIIEKMNNPDNAEKMYFKLDVPEQMNGAASLFQKYFEKTGKWPDQD